MIGALPLLSCRSSSNLLYSLIRLISSLIFSGGLMVNDSRNSESSSSPIMYSPSLSRCPRRSHCIILNIYWHNFWGFPPAPIFIDNNAPTGWGTRLHVINLILNSSINCLKLRIEPFLNLSNHFRVVGPRLEGNTLHINASLWLCKNIIWM